MIQTILMMLGGRFAYVQLSTALVSIGVPYVLRIIVYDKRCLLVMGCCKKMACEKAR